MKNHFILIIFLFLSVSLFGQNKEIDKTFNSIVTMSQSQSAYERKRDSVMTANNVANKTKENYINIYNTKIADNKLTEKIAALNDNKDPNELILLKRKNNLEHIELFTEAINKFPDYAFGYYARAYHKYIDKDYKGTIKDIEKLCSIEDCENHSTYHSMYSVKALAQDNLGENSIESRLKFIEGEKKINSKINESDIDKIEERIDKLIDNKQYKEAIDFVSKLNKIVPELDSINLYKRANCYFAQKDFEAALNDYNYILQKGKMPSYFILDKKSTCEENLRLYREAIATYDEIINKFPKKNASYLYRGIQYYHTKKYNEAIEDFNLALSRDSTLFDAYGWRGICYYILDKPEQAVNDLNNNIKSNTKNATSFYYRASAKYDLKQYQDAINDFEKAIELGEKSGNIFFMNGYSKYLTNQFESSILNYSKAIEIDPKNAKYLAYRGRARFSLNQFEYAIEDVNKAFEINDPKIQPFTLRGDCLFELKKYNEALNDYEKSLSISPENNKNALNGKEKVLKVLQEMKK